MQNMFPTVGLFALMGTFVCISITSARSLTEVNSRPKRETVDELASETFNFKKTCKGIRLTFQGKRINVKKLTFSEKKAADMHKLLIDESLAERMDVWCKMAKLNKDLNKDKGNPIPKSFDIEELNVVEGDIIVLDSEIDALLDGPVNPETGIRTVSPMGVKRNRQKRKVVNVEPYKWPNREVPWQFDSAATFYDGERAAIRQAVAEWQVNTCLNFPETTATTGSLIRVIKGSGCWSYVGRVFIGNPQQLSIGTGCAINGIIGHEFGHAIGLSHEQSRPDRDLYVAIDYDNVPEGRLGNFYAKSWSAYQTLSVPYDYTSVMHYGAKAFAADTSKDTIITLDPEMRSTIGQRKFLSFYDIQVVNKRYCEDACPGFYTLEWSQCQNGGYRNPNQCDECLCVNGFAPPFCQDPINQVQCGQNELTADEIIRTFSSPGYDDSTGHPLGTNCAYRFRAPEGMAVRLRVVDLQLRLSTPNCGSYLEVRHENMALGGPRFCGNVAPMEEFVSHGRDMLLTMMTLSTKYRGFKVEYTAERCGGCSDGAGSSEPACLRTEIFDCGSTEKGENKCFESAPDNKAYCCEDYTLAGGICTEIPTTTTTTTTPRPAKGWFWYA